MPHVLMKETDNTSEETTSLTGELFIELDVLEEYTDESLFRPVDRGVYIAKNVDYDEDQLIEGLYSYLGSKKLAESIVSFLGANSGKFVENILGFTPEIIGDEGGVKINLRLGKLHIPDIENFVLSLSVEQAKSSKCDLKLKIFGVNGGASKEYFCKITQEEKIKGKPVDLVIPINLTAIKWENRHGEIFYSYEVHSHSRQIKSLPAENEYQGPDGYEELMKQAGIIEPIDTRHNAEPYELSEDITEKTEFKLSAKISAGKGLPSADISGLLKIENKLKILYVLPTNYQYVQYADNSKELERVWAYKTHLIVLK